MGVSAKIQTFMERSSWIRKMFEEGAQLRAVHGPENVFDFSLGNPNVPPPKRFYAALAETVQSTSPGCHGYMPNAGYPFVRQAVADNLSTLHQLTVGMEQVLMTCGAAGGLNVVFKTLLDPGEEVLVPAPYFVEYAFYADNHGGRIVTVPTLPDFNLNIDAVADAITEKTRIMLVNFPNNPTGQVYSQQSLDELGRVLKEKSAAYGRPIYLVSDEPYRKIIYDDIHVGSIFSAYDESILVTSFSKDISIPGERIGYIAISPDAADKKSLADGMGLSNRILGFVSAPALMQRVVAQIQGESADMGAYARKKDLICQGLAEAGYEFTPPAGSFFLFPKAPIADDVAFVKALQEELVLTVPGSGFGGPGYFRIAFCVDDDTIVRAIPRFRKVMEAFRRL